LIGLDLAWLLQCSDMADWRQIQARIRKAKNSPEALAKLSELYQRTRDAMVAWELGVVEEKAGRSDEAGKWYTIAAQRFRRADWKTKAEEALARLGIELPPAAAETRTPKQSSFTSSDERPSEASFEDRAEAGAETPDPYNVRPPLALGEIPDDASPEVGERSPGLAAANGGSAGVGTPDNKKKRRRGRRGGRGRRRKGPAGAPGLPAQAFAESSEPRSARAEPAPRPAFERRPIDAPAPEYSAPRSQRSAPLERAAPAELPAPQLPSERAAHGRGDPALASRMAHLESLLRRLVGSPLHRLDEADEAPAGPGVFLLSDSDQVTSYYVEACQTLRIGLGNLVRGGRSSRSGRADSEGLKPKLAEHLGISESKVSQYMKEHCVVRWIQLDDEAPHLAHFAVGVLRTPLNVD
jgi:hypothetical protein